MKGQTQPQPQRGDSSSSHAAVRRISQIITEKTHLNLPPTDVLLLACASTTITPQESVEVLFNERIWRSIQTHTQAMAIRTDEMEAMFGATGFTRPTPAIMEVIKNEQFIACRDKLNSALRATLRYEPRAKAWQQPNLQCASVLALYMPDTIARIGGIIGEVVVSDVRWVEDLCADIEDDGVAPFMLIEVTRVLIESMGV